MARRFTSQGEILASSASKMNYRRRATMRHGMGGRMLHKSGRKPALVALSMFVMAAFAWAAVEQLPAEDEVRIREFYRLAGQVQDQIWPEWSKTPAPLL